MKLQIVLTMAYLILRVESQSLKPTRTYNGYKPGSGQLYYEDNVPRNVNTNNRALGSEETQSNTQQVQTQIASDSYLQAQQKQQNLRNTGEEDDLKTLNKPSNQNRNLQNQIQNQYQTLNQYQEITHNLQNEYQNRFGYAHQAPIQNNERNTNQNQYFNQSPNYQFQPSFEVIPPAHSSQDYYDTKQNWKKTDIRGNGNSEAGVLPVTLSSQSTFNTTLNMRLASAVISHIGIFMMKSAIGSQSNIALSPMSVVNMLALLQAGATGATREQITNALRLSPDMSAVAFQMMNTEFRKRGTQRNILRSASSIFAADTFELSRDFKNFAIQKFGSEVTHISFENAEVAAQKINSWVANETSGKIDKLVSSDSIGINTQLVLANALYFKGLWETLFKPKATSYQDFILSNRQKKSVPFMTLRSGFRAGLDKDNNAIVVVLPFEGNQYSMVMLLPIPGTDVTAVLANLNGDTLAEYQNLRRQDVLLEIPRFTVRGNTDLQPIFAKMGITKMFSPTSELNNIGLSGANSPQVSSAVHSAMISVDEQGATAAASTVVAVVALSYDNPSVVFRADRPFLAVLWDSQLNLPLFMAKIEDPSL